MRSSANETGPGADPGLPAVPVDPQRWAALSAFRRAVYRHLCQVPPGRVTTYGALAAALGCRCPRAVGQALRHNPFAPVVPCHRVVAADLSPGGFSGRRDGPDLARKRALLEAEGVPFTPEGRVAEQACVAIFRRQP